jgi:2,3-bisphosphoglycerate-independent phosphoglycerate mutase
VVDEDGEPVGRVRDGDGVVFFNFRADRVRQLTRALATGTFASSTAARRRRASTWSP